jgi:hypothetical protein
MQVSPPENLGNEMPGDLSFHRVRHIKCDETKPSCLRCKSTGRRCDEYLPPKSWLVQINPDNFEDGKERRSFQFFREQTGPELSRYYDESFWNDVVPQASQSQSAIKHCLIAISSFHEKLESIQTISDASYQTQYSLQNYGKAIHLLSRAPSLLSIEETLINCMLFIWFENLQNNLKNSLRHLDSGLEIVRETRRSQPWQKIGLVETVLAPMLERLKLKAEIYSPSRELGSSSDQEHFIPERFLDVAQACHSFKNLINWTCTVLRHITISRNNTDNWHLRSSKLARRLSGFDLYSARLEDLLNTTRSSGEQDQLRPVIVLKITNLGIRIIISAYLRLREIAYDQHKKEFAQIVELCQEYLRIGSMQNKTAAPSIDSQSNDFILESGVIPHLLFTSAHCRDPLLRQEVVSILQQYPRHEGVMDSHIASKLARRIAEIEKQDLALRVPTSDAIPEADRIRVLSLSFYKSETYSLSAEMMHEAQEGSSTSDQDECCAVATRIRISFLRCLPITDEISIEEDWIDETGQSIMVSSDPLCSLSCLWTSKEKNFFSC